MSENITMYDPKSDTSVELCVSTEDAIRARTDMLFASALMSAALKERVEQVEPITEDIEENSSQGPNQNSEIEEVGVYRWSDACVALLLTTYKTCHEKLTNGKQSHKKTWANIADTINKKGYEATGPQCAAKIRSLKKTYKGVKEHNNKSGNDRRTWKFFTAMDDIFARCVWVDSVAVASSAGPSHQQDGISKESTSDSGCEHEPLKRKMSAALLLSKRLKLKEKSDSEKEKRHKERMEMEERRLELESRLVAALEAIAKK